MSAVPAVDGTDEFLNRPPRRLLVGGPTLGQAFDPRSNALNAWRLMMATGVVLWHSWPLTGRDISFAPVHQLLRDVWVDGFFAISGFLITWSWFRHPRVRDYVVARGLRILPGLWACLAVTALVIAPIGVAIQGGSPAKLLLSWEPLLYIVANSAVVVVKHDIGGTPTGIPWPGQWDGPLWTLIFEAICYVAVAVLGVTGLLRRRWVIPGLLVLALVWSARLPSLSGLMEQPPSAQNTIDAATAVMVVQGVSARFAVMFLAGALIYQYRDRIPARWWLVALSVIIVLASSLLPNYRLTGAVPLAYAIIVSGALLRQPWLNLRTDLSYGVYIYGWPVQQLLIMCGLGVLNPFVFATVAALATLPLAALSWFVVEKPALAMKARLRRKNEVAGRPPPKRRNPGH